MVKEARLTNKQKKFVEEYLVDLNATAAALRAGYSQKTAYSIGHENTKKPEIIFALQSRREKLTKDVISPEQVIAEYKKIACSDIKDFLRFGTEKILVDTDAEGTPIYDYCQVVEVKPSEEVDGTLISEVSINDKGTFKFKLHDKLNALEKIGKHLGMFIDKHEHSGPGGHPLEILQLTPEERQVRIDELIRKREKQD